MAARRSALLPLLAVYVAARAFWFLEGRGWSLLEQVWVEGLLKVVLWVAPCILLVMALERLSLHEGWRRLGLDATPWRGYLFGLLATVPMALALLFVPVRVINPDIVVGSVLLGPFAEEVLFRGFLFGQLVTRARWPVPWAILLSSIAFGLAHVRDVDSLLFGDFVRLAAGFRADTLTYRLAEVVASVAVIGLGGALFAWVFHRLGSLWPAIGLHAFMNLWWDISRADYLRFGFHVDVAGAAQAAAMALAIGMTLGWKRTKRDPSLSAPAAAPAGRRHLVGREPREHLVSHRDVIDG